MSDILHRHWYTSVRRDPGATILDAKTVYCGTDSEVSARLLVDQTTFAITGADWEEYSPTVEYVELPELLQVEAYFNCGPVLKEKLAGLGVFPRSLFADTVRGIIQAETYLLKERGFNSAADYSNYWEKFYANSCRYYSNLHRINQKWYEYAGGYRNRNLFNRFKSQVVSKDDHAGGYRVSGLLSDSFHELSVNMLLDENLLITDCSGALLRAPDAVCQEAVSFLLKLPGQQADNMDKKQTAALLGQGEGCVHLIDIVFEGLESIKIARGGW